MIGRAKHSDVWCTMCVLDVGGTFSCTLRILLEFCPQKSVLNQHPQRDNALRKEYEHSIRFILVCVVCLLYATSSFAFPELLLSNGFRKKSGQKIFPSLPAIAHRLATFNGGLGLTH